jgi:hypothetical protein
MWAWHGDKLLSDAKATQNFFRFLNAPKGDPAHKISVIFFEVADPSDPNTSALLKPFIARAHKDSVRVDFLCGDASYVRQSKMAEGLKLVDEIVAYNQSVSPKYRFDGFQYDVEPYALPDWPTPELRQGYMQLFELTEKKIKAGGTPILLGAAIPRWFDKPDQHDLYKDVLDRVDYVAVMDYVDTSESFVNDGANTVAYATKIGKKAWLGVEASQLPDEPMATFYAKGNSAIEYAFKAASSAFGSDRGFAGVAIEWYDTYVTLKP